MIAVSIPADQVPPRSYVLAGSEMPRWRRVNKIETLSLEAEPWLRFWLEGQMPTYYEVRPDAVVLVGMK